MESLKLSITLPVSADELYKAWLSSKAHTAFTGAEATASSKLNGKFSAWDGYISGKNLELVPGKKIVQSWRTSEFADDAPDSILELSLEEKNKKTTLTLYHHGLQKGDAKKYTDGWEDFYFTPMKAHFGE
ncbi:MAG: SRPBCC domain-containing protein [Bacteroidia bacterium]